METTTRQNLNAAISTHMSGMFGNQIRYTLTRPGLAVIESDQDRYVNQAIDFLSGNKLARRSTPTEFDPETSEYYAEVCFG